MNDTYFIIVYPRGDQSSIATAEISVGMEYEEKDYDMASKKRFDDEELANTYARKLAKQHKLKLEGIPNILDDPEQD